MCQSLPTCPTCLNHVFRPPCVVCWLRIHEEHMGARRAIIQGKDMPNLQPLKGSPAV